ncbi:BolA/IbaG family iron-sulfur metabolism protein [Thioalkalivibrio sp. XN8]|uniref:BolA family protein n=1 Tax=Thioalkalivibrio sp. XN8 TaxID=2712863 RepID=UPI0013EA9BF8|nr:BolA/IbaG family iron-sulfur metabolism protein [Thioalkalivibrio sp. XN8]NGP52197.1 BolA/IbaG family iron-sulfur metabolism protein [Thioalkalivibrio sp. XN8]
MNREQVAAMIQAGLPAARVEVHSEDDVHFTALVVAEEFAGLRPLQRHQMVYRTLGDKMGGEIHALALTTLTPDELAAGR